MRPEFEKNNKELRRCSILLGASSSFIVQQRLLLVVPQSFQRKMPTSYFLQFLSFFFFALSPPLFVVILWLTKPGFTSLGQECLTGSQKPLLDRWSPLPALLLIPIILRTKPAAHHKDAPSTKRNSLAGPYPSW